MELEETIAKRHGDVYSQTSYSAFPNEIREVGTFGLTLIDVQQEAIVNVEPALSEIAFVIRRDFGSSRIDFDFGDGMSSGEFTPNVLEIQPADQDCFFDIPPMHLLLAAVDQQTLTGYLDQIGLKTSVLDGLVGQCRQLDTAAQLMRRMWMEATHGGAASNLAVDSLFLSMLREMIVADGNTRLHSPPPILSDPRLSRVIDYIEAHLDLHLTVKELADIACISVFHFGRAFKAAVGETPHRYVMQRRVERAKSMLLTPDVSVASVAHDCGFASQSHMTEVFKRELGVPPATWAREVQS